MQLEAYLMNGIHEGRPSAISTNVKVPEVQLLQVGEELCVRA
jgi:hypothetical protein